jgi:hypothetical protein
MQPFAEESFHGRRAWVLSNDLMRVSLLAGGGHIAEVRLLSSDPKRNVSPLRVPHYPTIEPHRYDPARDDAVYGDGTSKRICSGYMGHLLCFPFYGPPSDAEARSGLEHHGEAPIVEWSLADVRTTATATTLRYAAELPRTLFRVERTVTLPHGRRHVQVEEWVENLANFDRPINWMQHATFGQPFIEAGRSVLDSSATGAFDGAPPANPRVFTAQPHSGGYYTRRTDPTRAEQFFAVYHPDFRVLIGYLFPTADNPWIADWQENQRITSAPWNGKVVARGIEFGSSPYDEGLRASVKRGSLQGAPAYRWIGGRERLKTGFTIFLEEIAEGFPGVRDVRRDGADRIVVTARG